MAELNLNYDLPWMQQKPDSNQPMSLAEAFQLKQRQQQIDTEKALLPLKQQQMQANIANQALEHQIEQEKLSSMLKSKSGSAEMWTQISQTDWNKPEDVSKLWAIGAKYGAIEPEAFQVIQANTKVSAAAELKMKEFQFKALDDAAKQREIDQRQQQRFAQQENMIRLKSNLEKDALAIRSAGRAVSFDEFYNRHLNLLVGQGLDIDAASKEARRVYDTYLNKGGPTGPTPLAAPIDPKDPFGVFKP